MSVLSADISEKLKKSRWGSDKYSVSPTSTSSFRESIEKARESYANGQKKKEEFFSTLVSKEDSQKELYYHIFEDVDNGEVVVIPATKTSDINIPGRLQSALKMSDDEAIKRYKETGEHYAKFVDNKNKKQTSSGRESLSSALGLETKTAVQQAEEYVEKLKREQYKEAVKSGAETDNSYNFFEKLEIKNELRDEKVKEQIQKDAESIAKVPVLSSVASVVTNVLDGFNSYAKSINALGGYETRGADNLSVMTSAIRQKRGEAWDKALGTEESGVGSFAYSGVMAIADMATAILLSKGIAASSSVNNIEKATKGISQIVMSSQAASQTMTQAKERGLSGTQIFSLGVASAAIEALTEKYSLDALFSDPKNWATHVLKNIGTEATEEAVANVLNTIADEAIAGNKSVLKQKVLELMANGESYEDATQKVFIDKLEEVGLDALMGGLVGGIMGGWSAIIQKANSVQYAAPTTKVQSLPDVKTWVLEKFGKQKRSVDVDGVGKVTVDADSINDAVGQAENADSAVMFLALNRTLKKGTVVTDTMFQNDTDTSTEAPKRAAVVSKVTLNGNDHVATVSLAQTQSGEYIVNGITMDGETIYDASKYAKPVENAGVDESGVEPMAPAEMQTGVGSAQYESEIEVPTELDNAFANMDEQQRAEFIANVEKNTGVKVVFDETLDAKGRYKNGVITINPAVTTPMTVLKHELTHYLETVGLYGDLMNFSFEQSETFKAWMNSKGFDNIDAFAKDVVKKRDNTDHPLGQNGADAVYEAKQEILGDFVGEKLFRDVNALAELAQKKRPLFERIVQWFKNLFNRNRGTAMERELRKMERLFEQAVRQRSGTASSGEVSKYSNPINSKIVVNMPEADRADILRDGWIVPVEYTPVENSGIDFEKMEEAIKSEAEDHLISKLRDLGFIRHYRTDAVNVEFDFTMRGLRKSLHSQFQYGGSYADFSKVVTNLQELIDSSVLIETHTDKGVGTPRENQGLKQVYVLLGVLQEQKNYIPVQFEIKEYSNNENRLYLAVSLTKIETGVVGNTAIDKQASTALLPVSEISIPELFSKINPKDKKFLKYVPDEFLNNAQRNAKREALREEDELYGRGGNRKNSDGGAKYSPFSTAERRNTERQSTEQPSGNVDLSSFSTEELRAELDARNPKEGIGDIARLKPEDATTTPNIKSSGVRNSKGDGNSAFAESVQATDIFDDRFKELAATNDVISRYDTVANDETMEAANKALNEGGNSYVIEWLNKPSKSFTAEDIAVGFILMSRYQKIGAYSDMVSVAEKLRQAGTVAGQTVQMFSILSRMTPEGMLAYAQHELDLAWEKMIEKKTRKWIEANKKRVELTDEDAEYIVRRTLQAAALPEGRDKNIRLAEISARVQSKIPQEKGQAFKAYQRVSMLLNPKTQLRNVLGNALVMPQHIISDFIGTGIDKAISLKSGQRTTSSSLLDLKNAKKNATESAKAFKQGLFESWDDFVRHVNTRGISEGRFEISGQSLDNFNEHHTGKISRALNPVSKALNALDRFNSFLLDAGDRSFYQMWFINSLNGQMRANHVTEPTAEMIEIATQEALQRTWQDTNMVTKTVSGIKRTLNAVKINGYGLGDVLIKFTKTPANLTKAIFDFSPLGFGKALAVDARQFYIAATKGQATAQMQRKLVKGLSDGLTGSLFMLIAGALAKAGLLTGKKDEDKDVAAFERYVMGQQPYSVKVGNTYFSYDWAQPTAAVIAIAADYFDDKRNAELTGKEKEWYQTITDALKVGGQVLYDQSFMTSIQNLFSDEGPWNGLINAVVQDPTSLMPQLISQVASAADPNVRNTYEYNDSVKTMVNKVLHKLPAARNTLAESVDVLGETNTQYGGDVTRTINSFFGVANVQEGKASKAGDEIYRLYQSTGEASVVPSVAPNYITTKGGGKVTLDSHQREEYQKVAGGMAKKAVESLVGNKQYDGLSDDKKAAVISSVYAYSRKIANKEVLDIELDEDTKKAYNVISSGVPVYQYFLLKKIADTEDEGTSVSQNEAKAVLDSSTLTKSQKESMWSAFNSTWKSNPYKYRYY